MGILERAKRFSKAIFEGERSASYCAVGKQIACDHCGNFKFYESGSLLNTTGMTFLGLGWANQTATTLMCDNCGRIHWFGFDPQRI